MLHSVVDKNLQNVGLLVAKVGVVVLVESGNASETGAVRVERVSASSPLIVGLQ